MARMKALAAAGVVIALAACTPLEGALGGTGAPAPSAPANSLEAVDAALVVHQEAIAPKAKAWQADAILVGVKGTNINDAGVNFDADSRWTFTYYSPARKAAVTFSASTSGISGPVPGTAPAQPASVAGAAYDSDQAVLRYITIAKAKGLERFNLALEPNEEGTPIWQITAVDAFGKSQEQGSMNASTGQVTPA